MFPSAGSVELARLTPGSSYTPTHPLAWCWPHALQPSFALTVCWAPCSPACVGPNHLSCAVPVLSRTRQAASLHKGSTISGWVWRLPPQ